MENLLENNAEIPQEEYTFPNLIPSSECKELLQVVNAKIKPHKIIFWIAFGAFMLFMILTLLPNFLRSYYLDILIIILIFMFKNNYCPKTDNNIL